MGTTERRERERMQRRADILAASRKLFFTKGFRDTTIDEIARSTELARGTIYLYFATKEEIYASILEEGIDILYGLLTDSYSKSASPLDNLLGTLDTFIRFHTEYPEFSNVLMLHRLEIHDLLSPELQERLTVKGERLRNWMHDSLQRGMDSGDFRPMPIEETVFVLLSLNRGFMTAQDKYPCKMDMDRLRTALKEFVAAAVLAQK